MRNEEKTLGALCHLLAFSGLLIPFGHILGPLILWIIKKNESGFVDQQGRESMNFQISMSLYGIVAAALLFVVVGFILLPILGLLWFILTIVGGVQAASGQNYRYPLPILRLL